jgi:hypothetical protein
MAEGCREVMQPPVSTAAVFALPFPPRTQNIASQDQFSVRRFRLLPPPTISL